MNKENILLLGILGILIILMANNVFADVSYGTVSEWNLDDSNADDLVNETGGVVDVYGLNNGTLYGKTFNHGTNNDATWSNSSPVNGSLDKFGGYYDFDGVDDYIETDNSFIFTDDTSISFWINNDNYNHNSVLGNNNNFYGYIVSLNGGIVIETDTNADDLGVCSGSISNNVWEHITLVRDSSNNVKCYNNGFYIDNATFSGIGDDLTIDYIGAGYVINSNNMDGSIDEVKIWNRALTQAEIQEEINSNAVANPEGIIAYYDFNEDSGTNVYDNNHLTTGARQSTSSIDDPVFSWDKAINFDGVDDYIETDNSILFTDDTSISFWINNDNSNHNSVLGNNNNFYGYIVSLNGGIVIETNTNADELGVCSGSISNNFWEHITLVRDSSNNVKCYNNGFYIDNATFSGIGDDLTIDYIGAGYVINSNNMDGSIADVRIYDRALTEDEVSAIYYAGDITDFDSNSATYNNITTSNLNITPDEGEIVSFETEVSWATSIKWFLDGVLQKIGNAWDWYVGIYDAGEHTITTIATNDTYTASYETIADVQDVFPLSVTDISPKVGVYDVTIYATCFINDSRYWFKNSTFDFQLYYNNGTSTDWRLMGANVSKPDFPIFVEQIPNQQNVQLRCRSGDGLTTSDWSNVSTNLTINHPKNKIVIKDLSGIDKKSIFTNNLYQTECKFEDNYNITQLSNIFVDCNNDGLWDDMKKIYADDVKEESFIYSCEYEESGVYYMSTGCVYEKTDEDSSWQIPNCKGLPYTENYCVSRKMIEVMIYSPSEVLE